MDWAFAGTESHGECYCGNEAPTEIAEEGTCDRPCSGNSQQICGGHLGMHVYNLLGEFH